MPAPDEGTYSRSSQHLRLERDLGLLEQTSLSVSEVMAQVGISDPATSPAIFAANTGSYRRNASDVAWSRSVMKACGLLRSEKKEG